MTTVKFDVNNHHNTAGLPGFLSYFTYILIFCSLKLGSWRERKYPSEITIERGPQLYFSVQCRLEAVFRNNNCNRERWLYNRCKYIIKTENLAILH